MTISRQGQRVPERADLQIIPELVENLTGPGIGVSGVVAAAEFKVSVGYGIPLASAGPYAKVTIATGLLSKYLKNGLQTLLGDAIKLPPLGWQLVVSRTASSRRSARTSRVGRRNGYR